MDGRRGKQVSGLGILDCKNRGIAMGMPLSGMTEKVIVHRPGSGWLPWGPQTEGQRILHLVLGYANQATKLAVWINLCQKQLEPFQVVVFSRSAKGARGESDAQNDCQASTATAHRFTEQVGQNEPASTHRWLSLGHIFPFLLVVV